MKKINTLVTLFALTLTACASDYDFANVEIGENKTEVVAIMGEPASIETVQLPLGIQSEHLTWKNRLKGKIYQADFVLGKVVEKQVSGESIF
jgi:hypothetical protein